MHRRARLLSRLAVLAVMTALLAGCTGDDIVVITRPSSTQWPWETSPPSPGQANVSRTAIRADAVVAPPTAEPTETPEPTDSPEPTGPPEATESPAPGEPPGAPAPTATPEPTTSAPAPSPPGTSPVDPPDDLTALAAEVVALTNAARADHDCPEVTVDERLVEAAQGHSEDMAERDYFSHTSPEGDGPGERTRAVGYPWWSGENIARGQRTAEAVMNGWMNSDGHRANILNCSSVAIGVGIADSPRGLYWTQVFGRR